MAETGGSIGSVSVEIQAQLDAASFAAAQNAAQQQGRVIGTTLARSIQDAVSTVRIQPVTDRTAQGIGSGSAGINALEQQQRRLADTGLQVAATQQAVAQSLGPVSNAAARAALSFTPLAQAVANAGSALPGFATAATSAARGMAPLAAESSRVAASLPGVQAGASSTAQAVGPLAGALRQATAQMAATGAQAGVAASRLQVLQVALQGARSGGPVGGQIPIAPLTAYTRAAQGAATASASLGQATQAAGAASAVAAGGVASMGGAVGLLQGVVAGFLALSFVQGIQRIGQESQRSKIQIEALAGAYGELEISSQAVSRIAAELGISTLEARQGFSGLFAALRGTGVGVEQLEVLFVGLNKAARLSGAGAAEASGALLQLKQALSSGRLSGDELRSVLEAMPVLSQALARELGVTVGELKKLGAEGKITAETVFNAAKRIAGEVAPAQTSVASLGAAFTNARERIAEAFGPAIVGVIAQVAATITVVGRSIAESSGAIGNFAKGFLEVARVVAPVVIGIKAVTLAIQGLRLAQLAAASAQALLLSLSGPAGWATLALAVGFSTAAFIAIDKVGKGVKSGLGEVNAEVAKLQARFKEKLSETFWEGGTTQADALAQKAAQAREKIAELRAELDKVNVNRSDDRAEALAINNVFNDRTKSLKSQQAEASALTAEFEQQRSLVQARATLEEKIRKEQQFIASTRDSKTGTDPVKLLQLQLDTTQAQAALEKLESDIGAKLSESVATAVDSAANAKLSIDASALDSASTRLSTFLDGNAARLSEVYQFASQQLAESGVTVFDELRAVFGEDGSALASQFTEAFKGVQEAADTFAAAADKLQSSRLGLAERGLLNDRGAQEALNASLGQIDRARQDNPDLFQPAVTAELGRILSQPVEKALGELDSLAKLLTTSKTANTQFDKAQAEYKTALDNAAAATNNLTNAINELLPQIQINVSAPSGVAVDSNVPVRYA